jgi:hypothetical protein
MAPSRSRESYPDNIVIVPKTATSSCGRMERTRYFVVSIGPDPFPAGRSRPDLRRAGLHRRGGARPGMDLSVVRTTVCTTNDLTVVNEKAV